VVILGIDSDAKGSAALLTTGAWLLDVYALPNAVKHLKSGKNRLHLDYPALAATMADLILSVDAVWIEDQWSRPSQDIGAMFTFGQGFGDIRTAVAAALFQRFQNLQDVRSRIHFVSGADWKGAMALSSDKNHTREFATNYLPDCAHAWKLVSKHTSAAEATLIATYGAAQMGVKLPKAGLIKPDKVPTRTTHALRLI